MEYDYFLQWRLVAVLVNFSATTEHSEKTGEVPKGSFVGVYKLP